MTQVLSTSNLNNKNLNTQEDLGYIEKEKVVQALVEQGMPRVFNPTNFINKIAQDFAISVDDARQCLKEAIKEIEEDNKAKNKKENEEELYAQSGYFYPSKSSSESSSKKYDGMDSLSAYGNFQRLKFGL